MAAIPDSGKVDQGNKAALDGDRALLTLAAPDGTTSLLLVDLDLRRYARPQHGGTRAMTNRIDNSAANGGRPGNEWPVPPSWRLTPLPAYSPANSKRAWIKMGRMRMSEAARLVCFFMLAAGTALLPRPVHAVTTERISVDSAGNQLSFPSAGGSISDDGRFVAFSSADPNLVPGGARYCDDGDGGFFDCHHVFVRDRLTQTVEKIDVSSQEIAANDDSGGASISADGRFVVFASRADNLAPGDSNTFHDVFLRDRLLGTTERISVSSVEAQATAPSFSPSVSADGRFVAFISIANNLVSGDTGYNDVFVRDRLNGTTERVSVSSDGRQGGGDSRSPDISANGRFVAFESEASRLVSGDTNISPDIFVRDRVLRATERISVTSSENQGSSGLGSEQPSISADGRFIAFVSFADLVDGSLVSSQEVFLRDRLVGTTRRVSMSDGGEEPNGESRSVQLSPDGRFAAFTSIAYNLVVGDRNFRFDVFVRDLRAATTQLVSVSTAGAQAGESSFVTAISSGGRFVLFTSYAANLVARDTNGEFDVFLRDRDLAGARNDVLADFGSNGLWQLLYGDRWKKIDNASPIAITAGDLDASFRDEPIASFPGRGLLALYNNKGNWVTLHGTPPSRVVAGDFDGDGASDLAGDFGSLGMLTRVNNGHWARRTAASQGLAIADLDGDGKDDLIVDRGVHGLWALYANTNWKRLHADSPLRVVAGDFDADGKDDLAVDFSTGLWVRYNDTGPWKRLRTKPSESLATGDLNAGGKIELIADFGAGGLWVRYSDSTWVKQDNRNPSALLATSIDLNRRHELFAGFGNTGLWARFNDAGSFQQISPSSAQALFAGSFN